MQASPMDCTRQSERVSAIRVAGSAWSVERTLDRAGQGAMRSYAAPETIGVDDAPPGFRSDQFSVMVVCYEMLTGEIPYDR